MNLMTNKINEIKVINYNESYEERWDKFVAESNNGTLFHFQKFLKYHPEDRFNWHHLVFENRGNIVALLPAQLEKNKLISPVGATFGGFVIKDINYNLVEEVVIKFLEYCEQNSIKEVYLTPPLIIYNKHMNMSLDYALLYHGFKYVKHLYSSVINLQKINSLYDFSKRNRNAIRKAKKSGIKIIINDEYESFYPILVENKKKFNFPPTHTLEELKRLKQMLPERLKLFMVYKDDDLIGGSLIFICNSKAFIDFYIALDYRYQKYRPINLLLYEIINWGRKNGYGYFDIGVNQNTSSDNPMDLNRNLVSFKESMNTKCFLRSTFYKKIDGDSR